LPHFHLEQERSPEEGIWTLLAVLIENEERLDGMSSRLANPQTEAGILARLIERPGDDLSPGAAEYLLSMRFDELDIARMNELSELAREGKLTQEEQGELDSYIHVTNLIGTMQSKARRALRGAPK
jgi:hypothetical protein